MKKTLWLIILGTFVFNFLLAQDQVEMADTMRSNGKIYVVVAVACVVFAVITAYIITVDRRLTRLEKNITRK
jgi:CcmD family protein